MRSPPFLRPLGSALQGAGGSRCFVHPRDDAAQNKLIGDFRNRIRRVVGKTNSVLEIGPGYHPIFSKREGYTVASLDHDDQAGLVKKYAAINASVDTSKIEPVDFVWRDGKFADLIGACKFDAVVAAHVVEHAPDFIQFLIDSSFALKDEGVLFLIVPHKHYCFDYFQPISDPAKVLADHLAKRTRHSFESFYRRSMYTTGNGMIAWGQDDVVEVQMKYGDPREALRLAQMKSLSPVYVDTHENYFTPASFAILIEELAHLGEIDLRMDVLTRARGCEFLVTLKKTTNAAAVPANVFMQRKKAWCGVMMAEEFERLRLAQWPVLS
jgi:2-polyprenyl-3-methyl-5-hydroxy-6-metoxy-1,4-benzoquinol methylase